MPRSRRTALRSAWIRNLRCGSRRTRSPSERATRTHSSAEGSAPIPQAVMNDKRGMKSHPPEPEHCKAAQASAARRPSRRDEKARRMYASGGRPAARIIALNQSPLCARTAVCRTRPSRNQMKRTTRRWWRTMTIDAAPGRTGIPGTPRPCRHQPCGGAARSACRIRRICIRRLASIFIL